MSKTFDAIYTRSPVWLQQVAVAAWGFAWERRRFGGRFRQYVAELHDRDYWSAEQFRQYQELRLREIFAAAWRSPYYRERFEQAGMTEGLDPWKSFARAPLLDKESLRTRARHLLTARRLPRGVTVDRSSGSTGTPVDIYYPRDFHRFQMAIGEARSLNVAGVTYRDRRVMFGARKICRFNQDRPPFWRFSPAEDLAYCSIYHLSPQFLPAYLAFLRRFRPRVVMGYPSALHTVSRYAIDNGDLPPPAQCLVTTSETVLPEAREAMEAAFQCRLFDRYGAVEGCVFAAQCEHGRYHVSPDVGIVEILDDAGQPSAPGFLGQIVCTGLHNTLQPLIRYGIRDMARWAVEQQCPCGRQTPILEGIEGRVEDMCLTPDGRQVLRFDAVFKGIQSVKMSQVVQEKLDRFVIYVVPANGFGPADVETIRCNMRLHVGDVETRVECVDQIERTASGKFRAVRCALSAEERRLAGQAGPLRGNRP